MHRLRLRGTRGGSSARPRAVRAPAHQQLVASLLLGNLLLFTAFEALRGPSAYDSLYAWVGNMTMVVPTLACFAYVALGPTRRRAAALWLGLAMLSQTAGNVIFSTWTQFQADPPVPAPSDIAYLGFYIAVAAALVCLVRRDQGSFPRSLWLDGALGAAGAATALAAVLSPALAGPRGDLAEVLVGGAYTAGDLLLVAMICGLLGARGTRGGSLWLWMAGGLALFCAADVAYALRVSAGTYTVDATLHLLWTSGVTCIALAIWQSERVVVMEARRSKAILAIPMLATLVALAVLVIFSVRSDPVPIALATVTMLLAYARTLMAFRQARSLADARHQAITDELTGLGNRRLLFEHGAERLEAAVAGERLALILLDLDDFKEINDTFGHDAGDRLLRETARRLEACVGDAHLLVRLGGDEFAVLITLAAGDDGHLIANEILDHVAPPLVIDGARVRVSASAGVAQCEGSRVGVVDLLRQADVSLYAAKDSRARVEVYHPALDEANRVRLETIRDLDAAIAGEQFVLHYQPKIDLGTGATFGAEALVRWQHPTRGLLYPDSFLPLVEQSGLMKTVTVLVLEAAVGQLAQWRGEGLDLSVAVNLSASDLLDESLAERISGLLSEHGVPADALELEITESVIMIDPQRAREVLETLRRLGLLIAVDDYGTGYCALSYLRDLPVDELKIDRTFIDRLTTDSRSEAIVRSTIELAHALDMKVVAEGVEHQEALDALVRLDCDYAQGYHFSRPLPAEAFVASTLKRAIDMAPPRLSAR